MNRAPKDELRCGKSIAIIKSFCHVGLSGVRTGQRQPVRRQRLPAEPGPRQGAVQPVESRRQDAEHRQRSPEALRGQLTCPPGRYLLAQVSR